MPGTTDTVKAILTPGEFVIRKEAVDMIGVPMLNMINNMPEKGGHSNIDNLIARATIENMKGMYGGGMVQAGPKPMGTGGMVDAYAGGGMVMDQYGHGGKVKKNLKPVPQGNPGLGKLPEAVRNKMGYMQKGGMVEEKMYGYQNGGGVQKSAVQGLLNLLNAKKEDLYEQMPQRMSYTSRGPRLIELDPDVDYEMRRPAPVQDAKLSDVDLMNFLNAYGPNEFARIFGRRGLGQVDFNDPESSVPKFIQGYQQGGLTGYENGGSIYGMNRTPEGMMQAIYEMPTEDGNRYYLGESHRPQPSLSAQTARQKAMQRAVKMPEDSISFEMVQQILNPEAAEPEGKKGLMGLLGFQDGGMIGPTLPPEMMGQAMNRQLSDSINMRMADSQMVGGIGVARDQATALQDSINMNTVDSARKSLQLIKLQSLLNNPDMSAQQFTQGEFAVPSEEADLITKMVSMSRDSANARALDMMRMGMGPMSQPKNGMNGKVIEFMPYYSK